jgi:hypothetical protein
VRGRLGVRWFGLVAGLGGELLVEISELLLKLD